MAPYANSNARNENEAFFSPEDCTMYTVLNKLSVLFCAHISLIILISTTLQMTK